ncbi:MAG: polymer-forming cytoskeletal protein [Leeuwenhoekiella sp.]
MRKDRNIIGEPGNKQNRISEGTKIVGQIIAQGGLRIDGHIEGTIEAPGKVVLGKSGKITGDLTCTDADIEGTLKGKLSVSELLSLKSSASIDGEVITGKLAIEPGANFNATCEMKGMVKNLGGEQRKQEKGKSA